MEEIAREYGEITMEGFRRDYPEMACELKSSLERIAALEAENAELRAKFQVWETGNGGWCIAWSVRGTGRIDLDDEKSVAWYANAIGVHTAEITAAVQRFREREAAAKARVAANFQAAIDAAREGKA